VNEAEYWHHSHEPILDPRIKTEEAITPKQREVLRMREEGLTLSDMAHRLNLSRGAVLGRLSRARKATEYQ